MRDAGPDQLTVVAFDGSSSAACGISRPVMKNSKGECFVSDGVPEASRESLVYTFDEIRSWAEQGMLTLLPEQVKVTPPVTRTRVAFVSTRFMKAFGQVRPDNLQVQPDNLPETSLNWQALDEGKWATVGNRDDLQAFFEQCSTKLVAASTTALADYLSSRRPLYLAEAEDLADIALSCSYNRNARSRIYLRYGLAVLYSSTPERIDNLYSFVFSREFPGESFESFLAQVRRFGSLLSGTYSSDRLKSDSDEQVKEDVKELISVDDPQLLEIRCELFSIEHPGRSSPVEVVNALAAAGSHTREVNLDDTSMRLIGKDPFFFRSEAIMSKSTTAGERLSLNVVRFVEAMQENVAEPGPGPVATSLFSALKQYAGQGG